MKKINLFTLITVFVINFDMSAQKETIPLWIGPVPGAISAKDYTEKTETENGTVTKIAQVTAPTLTVYRPEKPNGTGILIFPGGGYAYLSVDKEGKKVAEWLNDQGITAFVVKYRLPDDAIMQDKSIARLQDAQQAMRVVRKKATQWNVDPNKIGVMGFSAGGHLAATLCTHYDEKVYTQNTDINARPDFAVLVYPVISMDEAITHKGSRKNLLGENPAQDQILKFSNENRVNTHTPQTFIIHAGDDKSVPVENSIRYYNALKQHNVSAELHIYEKGGHGFGLGTKGGTSRHWTTDCTNWLRERGLL